MTFGQMLFGPCRSTGHGCSPLTWTMADSSVAFGLATAAGIVAAHHGPVPGVGGRGARAGLARGAPLVSTALNLPGSAWVLGQWWTKGGATLSQSAVDAVSAGQQVLAVPVDRARLAARPVGAAHRRHRLAGPPPRRLTHRRESLTGFPPPRPPPSDAGARPPPHAMMSRCHRCCCARREWSRSAVRPLQSRLTS